MNKTTIGKTLQIDPAHLHAYSAGLLQGKAYRVLQASLTKVLLRFDLSIPEWKLLGQLFDHGTMKLAELADRLDVEPPLVTALVDKLEKKSFVKRTAHAADKRAKVITITKKGEQAVKNLEPEVKEMMGKLLRGVSREQLHTYILVLQTIVDNAE